MGALGIGVIGTGRGWPRWHAALHASAEAAVVAVHDPRLARAARAAEPHRAAVCAGVVELLERDDVEAVLLGPAWFGGWPLAHVRGKPVLCAAALDEDAAGVWPAAWPALWQGGRELCAVAPKPTRFVHAVAASRPAELLALCADLFGARPTAAHAVRSGDVAAWLVEFGGGVAQITLRPGGPCVVTAEGDGWARLELPGRLQWRDAAGRHARELPPRTAEGELLGAFVAAVRGGRAMPGLTSAASWLTLR